MSFDRDTFTCVDRVAACNKLVGVVIYYQEFAILYFANLHEHVEISAGKLETDGLTDVNCHRFFLGLKLNSNVLDVCDVEIPQLQFAIVLCFRIQGFHLH